MNDDLKPDKDRRSAPGYVAEGVNVECDIHGWVEFRDACLDEFFSEGRWYAAIDAGNLLDRSYSMFGSLFGVRNTTDFVPVAAGRGLPPHVTDEVQERAEEAGCGYHSHTWVTWTELQTVNWEEEALDGIAWSTSLDGTQVREGRRLSRDDPNRRDGAIWTEEGLMFSVGQVTRRQAAGDDFCLLMAMMEPLMRRYGGECVRLVVWFDN